MKVVEVVEVEKVEEVVEVVEVVEVEEEDDFWVRGDLNEVLVEEMIKLKSGFEKVKGLGNGAKMKIG